MHSVGYIHRDVKPDNFRIQNNEVKLIDFGLSDPYMEKGVHKPRCRWGFGGTLFFASSKTTQGFSASRRDDMESLGYSILYLMNPACKNIPWCKNLQDEYQVLKSKNEFLCIKDQNDIY